MFDFDDVPDDLGGPNKATEDLLLEAKQEAGEMVGAPVGEEREEDWALTLKGVGSAELGVRVAPPRGAGPGRWGLCAVFVPGMPQRHWGNARSTDPFPTAVVRQCWEIGLPTVRFDYSGYGRSKGALPADDDPMAIPKVQKQMKVDATLVLDRVCHGLSEKVVVIAFSAGNSMIIEALAHVHREGRVAAYVNVSMGTRATLLSAEGDALQKLQADLKARGAAAVLSEGILKCFDELDIPSLFMVADKDFMTPLSDIESIIQRPARKDRDDLKSTVRCKRLPGKHAFEGCETAPAEEIGKFLLEMLPKA